MFKQMVIGVLLALKRMASGRIQISTGQTQQGLHGVSNISAQTHGGKRKSQDAQSQCQSKPVVQKLKRKPKAAQSTTQASSRKAEPKSVRKTSGASGKQPATPVRQTPQHAKPKAKRKP